MSPRVPVITGIGLVTPLGSSVAETFDALMAGRYIRDHARTLLDAKSPDRIHRLARAAADEAMREASWRGGDHAIGRTACIVGTSKGAIEAWITAPPNISASTYVAAGPSTAGLAEITVGLRGAFPLLDGPSLTIAAACASGLSALIRAVMMLDLGEADRVLVVAAEASVHPLFLASFDRLGVLPREGFGCRPFDRSRDGFLMSEAAAAVCLECIDPDARHATGYPQIERFAVGSDAINMTAGDADGAVLRNLLSRVIGGRPVDLIHAHGTGTQHNDPIELSAYDDLMLDNCSPVCYSHKGALGHSLGAAGLIAVALSAAMHVRNIIPPNVQTPEPLASKRVRINTTATSERLQRSLCVASGFGGTTAVISLNSR